MRNLINKYLDYTGLNLNEKDLWDLIAYFFFDIVFILFIILLLASILYFVIKEFFRKELFLKSLIFVFVITLIILGDYFLTLFNNDSSFKQLLLEYLSQNNIIQSISNFFQPILNYIANHIGKIVSIIFFPILISSIIIFLLKGNNKSKSFRLFIFISLFLHIAVFGKYFEILPIFPQNSEKKYNDPNAEYGENIQVNSKDKTNQSGSKLAKASLNKERGVIMLDKIPEELKYNSQSHAGNQNEKKLVIKKEQPKKSQKTVKKKEKRKQFKKIVKRTKAKKRNKSREKIEFKEFTFSNNSFDTNEPLIPEGESNLKELTVRSNSEDFKPKEKAPIEKQRLVMEESDFQKYEETTKQILNDSKLIPQKESKAKIVKNENPIQNNTIPAPIEKKKYVMEESDFQKYSDNINKTAEAKKIIPQKESKAIVLETYKSKIDKNSIMPLKKNKLVMEEGEFKEYKNKINNNNKIKKAESLSKVIQTNELKKIEPKQIEKKFYEAPIEKKETKEVANPLSNQDKNKENETDKNIKKLKDIHKKMNQTEDNNPDTNTEKKKQNPNPLNNRNEQKQNTDKPDNDLNNKKITNNKTEDKKAAKKYSNLFKDLKKKAIKMPVPEKPVTEEENGDNQSYFIKKPKKITPPKEDKDYGRSTWHGKYKRGELENYSKEEPKQFYFGEDDSKDGWKDFNMGMSLGSDNSVGKLSIKGFDEYQHKSYMQELVNVIGKDWFYKYCPLQAIFLGTPPSTPIEISFEINDNGKIDNFKMSKKGNIKIQNTAVIKAFEKFKGLKPPKQFVYRNLKMRFVISKPHYYNSREGFISGSVYLNGQVKKKDKKK